MNDVIDRPKEGDVYRWHYLDPKADGRSWGSYHCCSCIGIFHNGRLRDTFWQIGMSFSEGRSFGVEDFPKLKLEYVGNLADFDKAPEYQADYYAAADCMNLNHSNSTRGNFYLRKGAQRNAGRMLEVARVRRFENAHAPPASSWGRAFLPICRGTPGCDVLPRSPAHRASYVHRHHLKARRRPTLIDSAAYELLQVPAKAAESSHELNPPASAIGFTLVADRAVPGFVRASQPLYSLFVLLCIVVPQFENL